MQPLCESPALATVAAVAAMAAADSALCHSPSAREPGHEQLQVPPWPWLQNLPASLRSGLTLWRKRGAAVGRLSGRVLRGRVGLGGARGARAHPPGAAKAGIWKLGRCREWSPCAGLGRRGAREGGVVGCPPRSGGFPLP